MEDLVLWKPLYYTSIGMFILSLVLFPISSQWSIVIILALVAIWSRIPGFIHFVFNKIAIYDLFTLIIAANLGGLAGGLFGVFIMLFSRIFGPNEWWPFTLRTTIAIFIGGISVPLVINYAGGINITAFYLFQGIVYTTYYLQVLILWREEIGLEILLLPAVIFFDFFLTGFLMSLFGDTISNMLTKGLNSGWPFIIFSGVILFYILVSRNGKRIARFIESILGKFGFGKKKDYTELENFYEKLG